MKSLIVPVDFSDEALNAARFAYAFAQKNKLEMTLLYVWDMPHTHVSMLMSIKDLLQRASEENLEAFRSRIQVLPDDPEIKLKVMNGDVADCVLHLASKTTEPMIVMGTHGATGFREYIGTNAAAVTGRSKFPVMVVPPGAQFRPFGFVTFATGMETFSKGVIRCVLDVIKSFKPEVTILHVETGQGYASAESRETLRKQIDWTRALYVETEGEDVEEALENYIAKEKPDLFCMATRNRSWIERIMQRSISRKITMHAPVPLLICPSHDEKLSLTTEEIEARDL